MTDRECLLRNILLNPAEDLPRLVFADWLQDNGEGERAEFIWLGCEFKKLDTEKRGWSFLADGPSDHAGLRAARDNNPNLERMERRQAEILKQWGKRWLTVKAQADWWSRGFVDRIELPTSVFLEHAGAIFREHPVMTVNLVDAGVRVEIDEPDGEGSGWQVYLYTGGEHSDYQTFSSWGTRDHMADEIGAYAVRAARRLAGLEPHP
jgi:uncharacterized protein (TIGR02996 family)